MSTSGVAEEVAAAMAATTRESNAASSRDERGGGMFSRLCSSSVQAWHKISAEVLKWVYEISNTDIFILESQHTRLLAPSDRELV
jgi:hypothetical protein